jgi:uncharacterized secreted repeat protein (TIGR03808 family)
MNFDRRRLLAFSLAAAGGPMLAQPARPAPAGLDVSQFGLRAGSTDDQSRALQRAIDDSARTRTPLVLPPGRFRAGKLTLPDGAQLIGVRGATRLVCTGGDSLISAERADTVTLSGLTLDGGGLPLPQSRALLRFDHCDAIRIVDCELTGVGGNGIALTACSGEISGNRLSGVADAALFSRDATGLVIARNVVEDAGNNGILVWRSEPGLDGTIVADNRITAIRNRSGGSGQYGNAINVFRAGNVVVRGNRIHDCAFSGVRGNAASNLQIEGNSITDMGEVALYAEFGFEGAVIANNSVDGAAIGISVTNFDRGGRLAVVHGNLIRNLRPQRPVGADPGDAAGIGLAVEADAAVSGNVIENAPLIGILLGWHAYLRDVAATGNVVRMCDIGIGVSIAPGAGTALIANNMISGASRGAVVGLSGTEVVTADLARTGTAGRPNVTLTGNLVR